MYCSNCGNQIQEGSSFCGSCGRPILAQQTGIPIPDGGKTKHTKISFTMILVIIGLVLIVFGILYANSMKHKLAGRWLYEKDSSRILVFSTSGKVEFISNRKGTDHVYDEGKWVISGKELVISAIDEYIEVEYNKKAWNARGSYWHVKGNKLYITGLGKYHIENEAGRMISRYWLLVISCIAEVVFVICMFHSTSKRKK